MSTRTRVSLDDVIAADEHHRSALDVAVNATLLCEKQAAAFEREYLTLGDAARQRGQARLGELQRDAYRAEEQAGAARDELDRLRTLRASYWPSQQDGAPYHRDGWDLLLERAHLLPPVTGGTTHITYTRDEFSRVHIPLLLGPAVAVAQGLVIAVVVTVFPSARISLASAATHTSQESGGIATMLGWLLTLLVGAGFVASAVSLVRTRTFWLWSLLCRWALAEELSFRGSYLSWTRRQRLQTNLTFGVVHLMNLIWTLASALSLIGIGFLYGRYQLHRFRRGAGAREAILAAAKLHASVNLTWSVVGILGALLAVVVALIGIPA